MGLPSSSLVGKTIQGGYRITRHIASGGMGDVYEAAQFGRRFAVKVLLITDRSSLDRFRQEALVLRSSSSMAHVVKIIDFVVEEREAQAFLIMELLEGRTLFDLIRRGEALPISRALGITLQILEALRSVHAAGIVHRDVKPSNVVLITTADGSDFVKLIDFGLAKVLSGGLLSTTMGAIVGTPAYVAPELLRGERPSPASDVHAVGVCLFQLLTGRRPWRAKEGVELVAEILREPPLTLASLRPELRALDSVLARALEKDPTVRFKTADAMIAALTPFAKTTFQTATHDTDFDRTQTLEPPTPRLVRSGKNRRTRTRTRAREAPPPPQAELPRSLLLSSAAWWKLRSDRSRPGPARSPLAMALFGAATAGLTVLFIALGLRLFDVRRDATDKRTPRLGVEESSPLEPTPRFYSRPPPGAAPSRSPNSPNAPNGAQYM